MPTIDSIETAKMILAFIVPGFVFLYVRSRFLTGKISDFGHHYFTYFSSSCFLLPFIFLLLSLNTKFLPYFLYKELIDFSIILLVPVMLGIIFGCVGQHECTKKILNKLKIFPLSSIPTSWDYKFLDINRTEGSYIIVNTNDGEVICGYFGASSFASSDSKDRDIYIEQLYRKDDKNKWHKLHKGHGLFIAGSHIKTIEFIPLGEE